MNNLIEKIKSLTIAAPVYHDYGNIETYSREVRRWSWGHLRRCWRYRSAIEKGKRTRRNVIDNIDVGFLTAWENPIQLAIDLLNPGGEIFIPAGAHQMGQGGFVL